MNFNKKSLSLMMWSKHHRKKHIHLKSSNIVRRVTPKIKKPNPKLIKYKLYMKINQSQGKKQKDQSSSTRQIQASRKSLAELKIWIYVKMTASTVMLTKSGWRSCVSGRQNCGVALHFVRDPLSNPKLPPKRVCLTIALILI